MSNGWGSAKILRHEKNVTFLREVGTPVTVGYIGEAPAGDPGPRRDWGGWHPYDPDLEKLWGLVNIGGGVDTSLMFLHIFHTILSYPCHDVSACSVDSDISLLMFLSTFSLPTILFPLKLNTCPVFRATLAKAVWSFLCFMSFSLQLNYCIFSPEEDRNAIETSRSFEVIRILAPKIENFVFFFNVAN